MRASNQGRVAWLCLPLAVACAKADYSDQSGTLERDDGAAGETAGGGDGVTPSAGSSSGGSAAGSPPIAEAGSAGKVASGGSSAGSGGSAAGAAGTPGKGGSGGAGGSVGTGGAGGKASGGSAGAGGKASGGSGGGGGTGGVAQATCVSQKLTATGVKASSVHEAVFPETKAIDGDLGTRWGSDYSDPQWIYADLGEVVHVDRVVINWEAAYATDYQIEVADAAGGPWVSLHHEKPANGGVDDFTGLKGTGRFVRMNGLARSTMYGYSLWELTVYGDKNEDCK
jgi:beta-galactosidase